MTRALRVDLPPRIRREDFLSLRWAYTAGDHVTVLGPTGSGKTTLAFDLLARTARPRLPAVVLVMKPRDATVAELTKRIGLRRTTLWPPNRLPFQAPPTGYTVWPRHTFDPDIDDDVLRRTFQAAIQDSYRRGNRIVFSDETAGLTKELGLTRILNAVWMRGRSMGCGLWAASQRPVDIPLNAYSQASHLFLAHDPDRRSRERFGEIGGIDARVVEAAVESLRQYEFLYIRREGQKRCILTP